MFRTNPAARSVNATEGRAPTSLATDYSIARGANPTLSKAMDAPHPKTRFTICFRSLRMLECHIQSKVWRQFDPRPIRHVATSTVTAIHILGIKFKPLPAQTFKEQGRFGNQTVRFDYELPNVRRHPILEGIPIATSTSRGMQQGVRDGNGKQPYQAILLYLQFTHHSHPMQSILNRSIVRPS